MGHKVVVIVGLVFAVLAMAAGAVAISGIDKGWWKTEGSNPVKIGFLKFSVGSFHCKYDSSCDSFFKGEGSAALSGGGKGALAAAAIALFLFVVGAILGIARLFERFGGHIGMGAAALTFMGAFFITASWAIMIGIWINYSTDSHYDRPSLDGDYALALAIVSTVSGIVAGACFAYAS